MGSLRTSIWEEGGMSPKVHDPIRPAVAFWTPHVLHFPGETPMDKGCLGGYWLHSELTLAVTGIEAKAGTCKR